MRRLRSLLLPAVAALLALPGPASAQFIPYFGKNKVKYDNFAWRVYKSPHFEVFYYPEFEPRLERLTSYLESGYLKISTGLKHEMPKPIPVIFYKTHSEFEQTNLYPAFIPEGVAAFTEPLLNRMVIPIDEPPDQLQGLITHEMVHAFAFDLIPRGIGFGISQRAIPLWVDEGLADYFRGIWEPLDLMMIRDAALTDNVPKLSRAEFEAFSGRLVYNMGHACFEFMESRYGKEGIRQFLYTLRKGILGGSTEELFKQAFRTTPEEFDAAFDKWLKERFKPFRDKQRPDDFGRDLSPNPEKTSFTQVFGFAPSPSGEIAAVITANRSDGEADVVLVSTKDGSVIQNLTGGFDTAWESFAINSEFVGGRSIAFDPRGDTVAFFGRTGKGRSLFLVSAIDGKVQKKVRVALDEVEAPCLLADGRTVLFAALKEGVSDIWKLDLETEEVTNLTRDEYADNNPQVSPDGKLVVYERRISGNAKIYAFPLADPARKTQLTFGPFDDTAPSFSTDGKKVYYSSNEDDDIPNLRSLDLQTGAIAQYTDVFGGAMAPAPLKTPRGDRLAFITYYKGEYLLHATRHRGAVEGGRAGGAVRGGGPRRLPARRDPRRRAREQAPEEALRGAVPRGAPADQRGRHLQRQLLRRDRGRAHRRARGPAVLLHRAVRRLLPRLRRALHEPRLAPALRGQPLRPDLVLLPVLRAVRAVLRPGPARPRDRDAALHRRAGLRGVPPRHLPPRRDRGSASSKVSEQFGDTEVEDLVCQQQAIAGLPCFINNGWQAPISLRLVQETTRFAEFGPLSGSTFSVGVTAAPGIGSFLQRTTVDADLRKYLRLGPTSALLALRGRGFYSTGDNPDYFYFGGNMEMRGYPYYSFAGNQGFFANAELRLPLIHLAATPIGIIGPLRGTVYFGIAGAQFEGQPYQFSTKEPGYSYVRDPVFGEPVTGWRLQDGRASWGFGVQLFFLGYPMHFDWTKYTDFATTSQGWDFGFWIGYDF